MAVSNLQTAYAEVRRKLEEDRAQLDVLQRRVKFLEQSEAGLRGLLGLDESPAAAAAETGDDESAEQVDDDVAPAEADDTNRPKSIDAVQLILKDHIGDTIHIDTIRLEMKTRGWLNPAWAKPDAAIYAALTRLKERDPQVERVGRHWRLQSTPVLSPPTELPSATVEDLFDKENAS
ncbi:MAG: hypothetical protein WCF33_22830 [Pseudonocardiaceae bacterium]